MKPLGNHRSHKQVRKARAGNFVGRRLHTIIVRCKDCAGALVSVQQYEVRSGQR